MTTLVTLELDPESQARFQALRCQHYPSALNRIPAHVTLFHKLPGSDEIRQMLEDAAAATAAFPLQVTGVRSLGRGVAYTLAAPELGRVHRELSRSFASHLTPQDRQRFAPHIVIQNKATPTEARELLTALQVGFTPLAAEARGLLWWEYLGGPWRLLRTLAFSRT